MGLEPREHFSSVALQAEKPHAKLSHGRRKLLRRANIGGLKPDQWITQRSPESPTRLEEAWSPRCLVHSGVRSAATHLVSEQEMPLLTQRDLPENFGRPWGAVWEHPREMLPTGDGKGVQ